VKLPSCCPGCGIVLDASRLALEAYVCGCGRHFPMHAEAWIGLLADRSTWRERWALVSPPDVPEWSRPRPYRDQLEEAAGAGLNEAVRVGTGQIGRRPAWLAVFDFRFVGGSLGVVAGERLVRTFEHAVCDRVPVVLVTASGGARMQEGPLALMQMARVNGALSMLHDAGLPFFSVLSHPTYGGTAASLALLADVNIAEPGAAIGFTGPRVIEQATHERLPPDFQTAEFQLRRGQVDMIVARTELRATLAALYDLFVP
jgi:acetyl-CoA carboxylase carboxyl transferase subunit beta